MKKRWIFLLLFFSKMETKFFFEISNRRDMTKFFFQDGVQIIFQRWRPTFFFLLFDFQFIFELKIYHFRLLFGFFHFLSYTDSTVIFSLIVFTDLATLARDTVILDYVMLTQGTSFTDFTLCSSITMFTHLYPITICASWLYYVMRTDSFSTAFTTCILSFPMVTNFATFTFLTGWFSPTMLAYSFTTAIHTVVLSPIVFTLLWHFVLVVCDYSLSLFSHTLLKRIGWRQIFIDMKVFDFGRKKVWKKNGPK